MKTGDVRTFLDEKVQLYNRPEFIANDPIQIPKSFARKENAEISGFLASTIAWGNRAMILKNGWNLIRLMDNQPFEFITLARPGDIMKVSRFVHRTFNGTDACYFLRSLKKIYTEYGGLEQVFTEGFHHEGTVFSALRHFRQVFLNSNPSNATMRHVPDVTAGSAAKRLNLFLRWMVRPDDHGIDLGLWKNIPVSALMLPLDVHTGRVARSLGILKRRANDWSAVEEVTSVLREFDPEDPVKYDFALFGLGIFEKF